MDNALRDIETSNFELEFRTKSDQVQYLLMNVTARQYYKGKINEVLGLAQDVTKAKKVRDRLLIIFGFIY